MAKDVILKKRGDRMKKAILTRGIILFVAVTVLAVFCGLCFGFSDGSMTSLLIRTHVEIEQEHIFGAFHMISFFICIVLTVVLVVFEKKIPDPATDGIVFTFGLIFLVAETYKQLYYFFVIGNGSYNFSVLPLQLCSYALYVCLLIPLLPECAFKSSLYSFFALYLTVGGCIVMGYPVLYADLALNLHTMLWHTLMIVLGVFIMRKRKLGKGFWAELLPSTAIFAATYALATVINVTVTPYTGNSLGKLNLFYMSPYIPTHYIVIGDVWRAFGWIPALLTYAALFIFLGAPLMWLVARLVNIGNNKNK
jgi:uncharacterized membrane protein YwaF